MNNQRQILVAVLAKLNQKVGEIAVSINLLSSGAEESDGSLSIKDRVKVSAYMFNIFDELNALKKSIQNNDFNG